MGRITRVQKSRKEHTCGRCHKKIEVGQSYLRGDLNFSRPIIRCCKCGLDYWEVTTSDYQLSVGEVVYRWHYNYEANEEGRDSIVSDLDNIREELQYRLDSMPESLQYAETGELLQQRIDCLDSAISELQEIYFEDSDYDEDCEDRYQEEIDSALSNIEI